MENKIEYICYECGGKYGASDFKGGISMYGTCEICKKIGKIFEPKQFGGLHVKPTISEETRPTGEKEIEEKFDDINLER